MRAAPRKLDQSEELPQTTIVLQRLEDRTDIFQRVADSLMKLIPCDSLIVYTVDWEKRQLQPVHALGKHASECMRFGFSVDEGIAGALAVSGAGEIIENILEDPRAILIPGTPRIPHAMMAVTLSDGRQTVAVLCLYCNGKRRFCLDELETARLFAGQAEVALVNVNLLKETRRRSHLLSTLLELGRQISSTLEIDGLCETIYQQASAVLDTTIFFITIIEEDQETLNYLLMSDKDEVHREMRKPVGGTVAGKAIKSGATVFLDETAIKDTVEKVGIGDLPRSGILVPIYATNKVVGAMSVQSYSSNAYDKDAVLAMEIVSRQAGVALHYAYLYQQNLLAYRKLEEAQDELIEGEKMRVLGEMAHSLF